MNSETKFVTTFENLSDEIIISIIEFLSLEDFISIFGQLNTRLAFIVFEHPWIHHRLHIHTMNNENVLKKLDFIESMKLVTKISSIKIRPFSIYRTIEIFHQYKPLSNFINLQALSLHHITLKEAEAILTTECLCALVHLYRICIIFSHLIERDDYNQRLECIISKILIHSSLRYCTFQTAKSPEFSQLQSSSFIEYFNIDYCSLRSLYTLLQFTPNIRHLTARIIMISKLNNEQLTVTSLLSSIILKLNISIDDNVTEFLRKLSKLQKLNIVSYSIIAPVTDGSFWFELIKDDLPLLIEFKQESRVAVENINKYIESFKWPNGWQLKETIIQNDTNYPYITIINTRH